MKTIKNIISIFCLVFTIAACSSEDKESIAATEIQNLTTQSEPGKINLTWEYPEATPNTNRHIEISYYDPAVKKEVKKTVSVFSNTFTVDNALLRYGEYNFKLQPFSTSLTPGAVQQVAGTAERATIIDQTTTTELSITREELILGGFTPEGSPIPESSCIGDGAGPERLLDNNTATFLNTAYSGVKAGTTYHLDLKFPQAQKYLKFSYINRDHASASYPSEIECYVKVNEIDEWTLIKTLQQEDGLPAGALGNFTSEVYDAPFEFNFFRFKVLKTHTAKVNFSMAEFRIYDVKRYYFDPEAIIE